MELRHLRYFTAVVEAGTYRAASQVLNIAQPAISQTVSDLESELGVSLFTRVGRKVSLSPSGKAFYSEALEVLSRAGQAILNVREFAANKTSRCRIGFWSPLGNGILQKVVQDCRTVNPEAAVTCIDFDRPDGETALLAGEIDLWITKATVSYETSRYFCNVLSPDGFYLAVPTAWSREVLAEQIQELRHARLVLLERKHAPELSAYCWELVDRLGLQHATTYEVHSLENAIALVRARIGFSIVPACVLKTEYPDICFLEIPGSENEMPLLALQRRSGTPWIELGTLPGGNCPAIEGPSIPHTVL